jgi:hypothetical protein
MSEIAPSGAPQPGVPNQPAGGVDPKSKQLTKYIVLTKVGDTWTVDGREVEARSPQKAVDQHMDVNKLEEGTFVAVPARSWDPITVRSETRTRRIFE